MTPKTLAGALVAVVLTSALTACGSDGLAPDVTVSVTDMNPPATDTRTPSPTDLTVTTP